MLTIREHIVVEARAGSWAAVVASARTTLMAMGFVVTSDDSGGLFARGPGWNSTKQPSLLAASRLWVTEESGQVRVRAELGGLRKMQLLLCAMPLGTVTAIQLAAWGMGEGIQPMLWVFAGVGLPVFVYAAIDLQRQAYKAVDGFAVSVAASM